MNRKTIGKLRSQTGASLSFALLLFLVCAVLCSVILVSATTAAGRMSKIAETDQRYYAVTSAAELLKDLINGKTVTIEEVTKGTRIEVYVNGELKSENSGTSYDEGSAVYMIGPDTVDPSEVEASPTFSSIPEDAAYQYYEINEKTEMPESAPKSVKLDFTMDFIPESSDDNLKVTQTPFNGEVFSNGDMTLIVGDKYKIKLVFSASVDGPTVSEAATKEGTAEVLLETDDEIRTQIKTDMEKTETTTLTWTLTGIKTFV